ncbi:hypothetical protein J2S49_000156 [Arcanobacterium wilhelmae]|uniref:RNA polymerase sigma-70 region 4 domain-containing protein n=1 Tax=Arcanobacterium wilhelmae TaxID=1803177 RepID=A0ABT9N8Q6_9ACTO|nr:hypothetical protein [Arcanobacterium wilhelmae]MDP9800080.1 hypothetical protein [Arcanobacterium wilhelmae]WFN89574.1 hypothetical protein P8A24_05010 [Arcanobacterium wilhelmae]
MAEDQVGIHVVPRLPRAFTDAMESAKESRRVAEEANARSAREYRQAARVLQEEGITLRDIGMLLGVSYQRAGQLTKEA